ncbi:MAG: hypothetical protein ACE5FT_04735 [Candidatus Nanoarchaeia archaeon]
MEDAFCDKYGYTRENLILSHILCSKGCEFSVDFAAEDANISELEAQKIVDEFECKGWIKKTQVYRNRQLYTPNMENKDVQEWYRRFMACLKKALKDYKEPITAE